MFVQPAQKKPTHGHVCQVPRQTFLHVWQCLGSLSNQQSLVELTVEESKREN